MVDAPNLKGEEVEIANPPVELLRQELKDKYTGFTGKVKDIIVFMTGCCHATLQPDEVTEEGETVESDHFDITRLEGVAMTKYQQREATEAAEQVTKGVTEPVKKGGPFDAPSYHHAV